MRNSERCRVKERLWIVASRMAPVSSASARPIAAVSNRSSNYRTRPAPPTVRRLTPLKRARNDIDTSTTTSANNCLSPTVLPDPQTTAPLPPTKRKRSNSETDVRCSKTEEKEGAGRFIGHYKVVDTPQARSIITASGIAAESVFLVQDTATERFLCCQVGVWFISLVKGLVQLRGRQVRCWN